MRLFTVNIGDHEEDYTLGVFTSYSKAFAAMVEVFETNRHDEFNCIYEYESDVLNKSLSPVTQTFLDRVGGVVVVDDVIYDGHSKSNAGYMFGNSQIIEGDNFAEKLNHPVIWYTSDAHPTGKFSAILPNVKPIFEIDKLLGRCFYGMDGMRTYSTWEYTNQQLGDSEYFDVKDENDSFVHHIKIVNDKETWNAHYELMVYPRS